MKNLILLHGALGNQKEFDGFKPILSEHYNLYSFDFNGHGNNANGSDFSIEAFAEQLIAFIEQENLGKVEVFGYSMGGYVALYATHLKNDCIDRIVTFGTKFDWTEEFAKAEVVKLNPDVLLEKHPSYIESLIKNHPSQDWRTLLNNTCNMMLALGERNLLNKNLLQILEIDITICVGDQDHMVSIDESKEVVLYLPKGKLIICSDTKHAIHKLDVLTFSKSSGLL